MCALQTLPVISPSEERETTNEYFLIPDGFARTSSDRHADSLWGKEEGRAHVHMLLSVLERQRQRWVSRRERRSGSQRTPGTLLSLPPQCQDYRHVPPNIQPVFFLKNKTWLLGTQTYTWVTSTLVTEPACQSHHFKIIVKNSKTTKLEGEEA